VIFRGNTCRKEQALPSPASKASLARKTSWAAAASACTLSARLIVQIVLARMLGPEGVGRIAYLVWLIEIASIFSCLGLCNSLTRYLAELHGRQKAEQAAAFAQWVFVRYLALAVLGSAVVGLLFLNSSQYAGLETALPALMVFFLARGLQAISIAELTGRQRFDLVARINVAATVFLLVGVSIGAYFYGVVGALYGYIAGATVPAVYSLTILRNYSFKKIDPELRRRVWSFALHTWMAMVISAFVWSRMEVFFLERYWDDREVAMFVVGLTFAMMVRQAAGLFTGAFMPHFSQLVGQGQRETIQRHYETGLRLMALVVVPCAFGGAAVMPVLLPLAFGQDFLPAVPNAMVLTAGSATACLTIGSSLIYAMERSRFIAAGGFLGAALSVAAGFVVISRFGAWGAVWAKLFVQCSMIALTIWYFTQRLHYAFPFSALGRTLSAGGVCAVSAWCVVRCIPSPILALSIAVPTGAVVYTVGLKVFHVLGAEEKRQLTRVANRLPVRLHRPLVSLLDRIVLEP